MESVANLSLSSFFDSSSSLDIPGDYRFFAAILEERRVRSDTVDMAVGLRGTEKTVPRVAGTKRQFGPRRSSGVCVGVEALPPGLACHRGCPTVDAGNGQCGWVSRESV